MNRLPAFACFAAAFACMLAACNPASDELLSPATGTDATLDIYTVNYPVTYFAERLVRELPVGTAAVHFPVPPDTDPAWWMPEAETVRQYQQADLIVLNGAHYAAWIDKVSLPEDRILDPSAAFDEELIENEAEQTHSHGPEGEHSHATINFNLWLDPVLAGRQAGALADALLDRLPDHKPTIDRNAAALQADLQRLDRELHTVFERAPGQTFLASHPVYPYLAKRYNITLKSFHFEPDEMPSDAQWQALEAWRDEHGAAIMLWEDEPLPAVRERLQALAITPVVFRTGGNRPASGDFLSMMENNIQRLNSAIAATLR